MWQVFWNDRGHTMLKNFPGFGGMIADPDDWRVAQVLCGTFYCFIHNRIIYYCEGVKAWEVGTLEWR